ncbi:lipid II flippase Amj family protein [Carboxydothermus ferrireducens]|uniref:Lipid II flippase Amj n=1 Tax=Carboxydothermus ferrireducens DSM 11255 TaxID=1119529 RepID=A0ABX2RDZ9_9THEO|nr:lipid II flippase Amj family protein [Carboxydothermus ferrireducens]NYE58043.1 hypothetical protein [Carboxydothermus ferrireducens DSM 11255]
MEFNRIALVVLLTLIIHLIDTLSFAARIAGIKTKKLALAGSVFNIIVLVSRTSNMIQAPLLGSIVEIALLKHDLAGLEMVFRWVLLGATAGTLIGAVLIPTFINFFTIALNKLDEVGSVPRLIIVTLRQRKTQAIKENIRGVPFKSVKKLAREQMPYKILLLNLIITGIYTTGVLSAMYAGVLNPEYRLTASQLSGIINGFATIVLVLLVDPYSAMVTDRVLNGALPLDSLNRLVLSLVISKFLGTLLSQAILIPAAWIILYFTRLII